MSAIACQQPGCTGQIVDGYCDVCGMAPTPGTAPTTDPAPTAAPAPRPTSADDGGATVATAAPAPRAPAAPADPSPLEGFPCTQPGCRGTFVDGYCDVCGTAAHQAGRSALDEATAPMTGRESPIGSAELSSRSAISSAIASTALGSSRARAVGSHATRSTSTSQRLRSARLGGGLTTVAPAPAIDASAALLVDPVVPESKRFCPQCGEKVGRSVEGRPGRSTGFCANCRHPFSFDPKLAPGDLVAGQYLVAGCLAHGGLGWIYLARDKNVSDRWVVLKGLLNSADPDALAAAIAEQRFLAQVSHPNIVEIYNFVTHDEAGYIVMEYVGGVSLKSILKQRMAKAGAYDPLPVDQALAYILEILPAFAYLHDLGLVYCDFKPDNIIQVGDEVKLIDLGGVRRIDDDDSAIFGTLGYQAPEVAELGTSVASDIYTIGRTLIVLTTEFRGYQTTYLNSLPPQSSSAALATYDSFYRLVAKACAPNRDDRFVSADELRSQMVGVLREVVAINRGAGAADSTVSSLLFEAPEAGLGIDTWRNLPRLRRDPHDSLTGWLHTVSGTPAERLDRLTKAPRTSTEVLLETGRTALEAGRPEIAESTAAELLAADPWEWRAVWLQGLAALDRGDATAAQAAFNAVYGQVPGELAPKLALAQACELAGDLDIAENLYIACARTDSTYVPMAAFGLARIRSGRNDIDGARSAYRLVSAQSSAWSAAQFGLADLLVRGKRGIADLSESLNSLEQAAPDPLLRAQVTTAVHRAALEIIAKDGPKSSLSLGGQPLTEAAQRVALEKALRELARATPELDERIALVDQANAIRPWSLT